MSLSEKQKALIRIGTAYINDETPNPLDVEIAKRNNKGGRPKGRSEEHFYRMLNLAFSYIYARKKKNMTPDEAFDDAMKLNDVKVNVDRHSLKEYCSFLRSGATPPNPKWQTYLEHTRAALEQVEHGFMKLPNHPDYKPRI